MRGLGASSGDSLVDSLTSVLSGRSAVKTDSNVTLDASGSGVVIVAIGAVALIVAAHAFGRRPRRRRRRRGS